MVNELQMEIRKLAPDRLVSWIGHPIDDLIEYEENVETLRHKAEKLADQRRRIEGAVDRAVRNGQVIEAYVEGWLSEAHRASVDVDKFLEYDLSENKRRLMGLCPNIYLRYRQSKEARRKISQIVRLTDKGMFDVVSFSAPPPIMLIPTDYVAFESRERVFEGIMEALKDDEVRTIGIYGMGGVGKTTMAMEVGRRAATNMLFHEVVWTVVSPNPNVRQIQSELADQLSLVFDAETELGRAGQLYGRLKRNEDILVILDDIWDELDLKAIGIPFTDDGVEGSKILLISRSGAYCNVQVQRSFLIEVLSMSEAWDLFTKTMGDSINSPEVLQVAEQVCKECGGLPVAISAVASALKYKSLHVWIDALNQLRKSTPENIDSSELQMVYPSQGRIIYHLLSEDAKLCFSLCLTAPEDAEISIDYLVRCGTGTGLLEDMDTLKNARSRVHTLVNTLRACSLLLRGKDEEHFKMPMRAMARSIALEGRDVLLVKSGAELRKMVENGTYVHYRAICLRSRDIFELPDGLQCPNLNTLMVDCSNLSRQIPDHFFNRMDQLNILNFNNMLNWQPPVQKLGKLRMLCLNNCQIMNIHIISELTNLEILDLSGSDFDKLPTEIGQLTSLRLLNLKQCDKLKIISPHVISSLSLLEELYFPNNFDQWEFEGINYERRNASLDELKSLSRLDTLEVHIPNVLLLPQQIGFETWTRFKISIGSCFDLGGDDLPKRMLKLSGFPVPNEISILVHRAEILYLDGLKDLKNLTHNGGEKDYSVLEFLQVRNCDGIDYLIQKLKGVSQNASTFLEGSHQGQLSLTPFSKLIILNISDCKLKCLFSPSAVGSLVKLEQLEIISCRIMEEVVGKEMEQDRGKEVADKVVFNHLKLLKLEILPNLRSFERTSASENLHYPILPLFNEMVVFPALEKLYISGLHSLKMIWHHQLPINSFSQLSELNVESCDNMTYLLSPSTARGLVGLQILRIENCKMMEEIVAKESEEGATPNEIAFPQANILELKYLPRLKRFYSGNSSLLWPLLKGVWVKTCYQMETFSCGELSTPSLDAVQVEDGEHLWEDNLNKSIKYLFERKERRMHVEGRDELNKILGNPSLIESFYGLKYLVIRNCDGDKNVLPLILLEKLEILDELSVELCNSVEEVFDLQKLPLGERAASDLLLPQLTSFKLSCLQMLKHIWNQDLKRVFSLQILRKLHIFQCNSLRNLFSLSFAKNFLNLQTLEIIECKRMEEIIGEEAAGQEVDETIVMLPHLKHLELTDLPSLACFYSGKSTLTWPSLEVLMIKRCSKLKTLANTSISGHPKPSEKVTFNRMKLLHLICLDNFIGIWHGQIPSESFRQLHVLEVDTCGKLLNVIPSDLLPSFENLKRLTIRKCSSLEAVFDFGARVIEEIQPVAAILPCLDELVLADLPIKQLSKSDFRGMAAFPTLQVLKVSGCGCLGSLFSPSMARCLAQLKEVDIVDCMIMTEIIMKEKEGEEINTIVFPQLSSIKLEDLPNLVSFCKGDYSVKYPSLVTLWIKNCPKMNTFVSGSHSMNDVDVTVQALLTEKASFGRLQELHLSSLHNLKKIWNEELPEGSFSELRVLVVESCSNLFSLSPSNLLTRLQKLEKLTVEKCGSLEEVFDFKGLDDVVDIKLLPQLSELVLTRLPKLLNVLGKEPAEIPLFQNLKSLQVIHCNSLKNLFAPSTARFLEQLEVLKIFGCEMMVEVISGEGRGAKDNIVFPKLNCLILKYLENLTYFCSGDYTFEWPSLETLRLKGVPQLLKFAPGVQIMPKLKAVDATFLEKCWKVNLNTTLIHLSTRSDQIKQAAQQSREILREQQFRKPLQFTLSSKLPNSPIHVAENLSEVHYSLPQNTQIEAWTTTMVKSQGEIEEIKEDL